MKNTRIIAIFLALVMLLGLAGCSDSSKTPQTNNTAVSNAADNTAPATDNTANAANNTANAANNTANTADSTQQSAPPGIDTTKYKYYDTGTGLSLYMGLVMLKQDAEANGLTTFYATTKYMMAALQEKYEIFTQYGVDLSSWTLEQYADLIKESNNYTDDFEKDSYGNLRITYVRDVGDSRYFYYSTVRKAPDAFWLIHFACLESDKEVYEPIFELLGSTIEVKASEN